MLLSSSHRVILFKVLFVDRTLTLTWPKTNGAFLLYTNRILDKNSTSWSRNRAFTGLRDKSALKL